MFFNNQLCIKLLNNVTVLLKHIHAVRQWVDKGSFLKMTSFRQLVFTQVLVLISSLRPITGMPSLTRQSSVCRSQNKPRKFSKPGSQYNRAVVGWALGRHTRSFSATLESSTAPGCSPLRMGVDSQERCAASHAFGSTSLWGSYCCRRGPYLTQVNWFRRERDIHS